MYLQEVFSLTFSNSKHTYSICVTHLDTKHFYFHLCERLTADDGLFS